MATASASGAPRVAHGMKALTITEAKNSKYGSILVEGDGFTVYRYTADSKDKSVCTGGCATTWPPVLLPKGQSSPVGKGVSKLGVITRSGGGRQVTYEGIPLYLYAGDTKAGQANGEGVNNAWYAINPAKPKSIPKKTSSGTSSGYGSGY